MRHMTITVDLAVEVGDDTGPTGLDDLYVELGPVSQLEVRSLVTQQVHGRVIAYETIAVSENEPCSTPK